MKDLTGKVIDPVCGRGVERTEISIVVGSKSYFFCSNGCKERFGMEVACEAWRQTGGRAGLRGTGGQAA